MARKFNLGKAVQPLSNVMRLATLVERVENRAFGLPGMAVFHGFPGLGKSFGAAFCANNQDCIHISVQQTWTQKFLLEQLLHELDQPDRGTLASLAMRAQRSLAISGRTLIIDEADYAVKKGMINMIRDLHDNSGAAVILIGMENLPQMLRSAEQVDGRIASWVQAEPADEKDAELLAKHYAPGVTIAEDLRERIRTDNRGSARYMARDFAVVLEHCRTIGEDHIDLKSWGGVEFPRRHAPAPRGGVA
ncbi:MAG: ATP-binding protein [Pseudomonadota bacterium]